MNLSIRKAGPKDVPGMLEIYRPFVENSAITFEVIPPPAETFRNRVAEVQVEAPWLVCISGAGEVAGFAYAGRHRKRAAYRYTRELSVYVRPEFRRRGIATGLYVALIELLKLQGYSNALIGITMPNPGSIDFHESMGFRPVGVYHRVGIKSGRYYDVGWWEMALSDAEQEDILLPADLEEGLVETAIALGMACLRD